MPAKPSELDLNDGPARASKLFLVDANGLMFRAFYALPEEIATSEGEPTNALLGFANMLMKLLTTYRPQGVLVCWDEKPTHRLEMHPGYKASRRPMPDLLAAQRPHFRPLVEAFANGTPVESTRKTIVSEPSSNGLKTILNYQMVGDTKYFDTAGFEGRSVGLETEASFAQGK